MTSAHWKEFSQIWNQCGWIIVGSWIISRVFPVTACCGLKSHAWFCSHLPTIRHRVAFLLVSSQPFLCPQHLVPTKTAAKRLHSCLWYCRFSIEMYVLVTLTRYSIPGRARGDTNKWNRLCVSILDCTLREYFPTNMYLRKLWEWLRGERREDISYPPVFHPIND